MYYSLFVFVSVKIDISYRLRAVSLFSWFVKQNARDTQMTTRVTEAAKTGEAAALVSCVSRLASRVSRLAASPLNARARVHSPYQIWRKGETARSLYIICHSSQLPLLKKNRESKIMYNETQPSYNQPLYNEKTTVVGTTFPLLPVPDPDLEIRGGGRSSRSLDKGGQSPKKIFSAPWTSVCLKIRGALSDMVFVPTRKTYRHSRVWTPTAQNWNKPFAHIELNLAGEGLVN